MNAETVQSHAPHGETALELGLRQRLGVVLLIMADASFVASLIFTYFYLRGLDTDGGWIPRGTPTLGILEGWVIAIVVVLSAAAYRWGQDGLRAADNRRFMTGLAVALLLLLADLGLQIYRLATLPFSTSTGSYASIVITFAGSHLVHLLITLFLGVAIWNRARRGLFTADSHWHVRLVGYWWTWVAVSAVLLAFTASFVASPHVV